MKKLVLAVAFAVPLAFAAAASADTPTSVQETLHRSIPTFATCPGFTVRGEFDVTRTVVTFYDGSGVAIRRVFHVHFTGTLSNSVTGKSLADEGNQVVTQDLVAGTTTIVGRQRMDTEPGLGVVFADAGRVIRDPSGAPIFLAGQHDLLEGEIASLCNFLAG